VNSESVNPEQHFEAGARGWPDWLRLLLCFGLFALTMAFIFGWYAVWQKGPPKAATEYTRGSTPAANAPAGDTTTLGNAAGATNAAPGGSMTPAPPGAGSATPQGSGKPAPTGSPNAPSGGPTGSLAAGGVAPRAGAGR
jgi:hypothetical protein